MDRAWLVCIIGAGCTGVVDQRGQQIRKLTYKIGMQVYELQCPLLVAAVAALIPHFQLHLLQPPLLHPLQVWSVQGSSRPSSSVPSAASPLRFPLAGVERSGQFPCLILNCICCKPPFLSPRAGVERSGQFPYLILNAFGEQAARDQHWQGQCCSSGTSGGSAAQRAGL